MNAARLALIVGLLLSIAPRGAAAFPADSGQPCRAGTGWRWVSGPDQPQAAQQARAALAFAGLSAEVSATGYGEVDDCGAYLARGVDLRLRLPEPLAPGANSLPALQQRILGALEALPGLRAGNIQVQLPDGQTLRLHANQPAARALITASSALPTIHKKVYVVAYNPYIDAGHTQRLWEYIGWNSFEEITQGTIDFFFDNSYGQIQYSVAATTIVNAIPEKQDGYVYSIPEYLQVINDPSKAHQPDLVNYNKIVNDPQLDICGKANRGEIDEVWVFNGPYYGLYESTLVGPGSYWYNSPPVEEPWTCTRMIPIMGPNPERWISEHVEDFGHRTESTMWNVYGYEWANGVTRNAWEKFTLLQSNPFYNYSGCGNVHYPPNGQSDYDWSNPGSAATNCADFLNYPNLPEPPPALATVTCATWGCSGLDYFGWWYRHLPHNPGCGPDAIANNWWRYFIEPALAPEPHSACALERQYSTFAPLLLRPPVVVPQSALSVPSQAGDGEILLYCWAGWSECRGASFGSSAWTTYDAATAGASKYPDGHFEIKRIFLSFDTSALPANALITSAALQIYGGQYQEGGDRRLHVVQGLQNLPLTSVEFSHLVLQSGGSIDLPGEGTMTIPLNGSALDWIVRGGTTRLALVHELDLANRAPTIANTLLVYLSESSHPPLLKLQYTLP